MITVLILFFSKCSPLNFSGKSGLKILLKLSEKIAAIVACQFFVFLNGPNSFSETRILG